MNKKKKNMRSCYLYASEAHLPVNNWDRNLLVGTGSGMPLFCRWLELAGLESWSGTGAGFSAGILYLSIIYKFTPSYFISCIQAILIILRQNFAAMFWEQIDNWNCEKIKQTDAI